MPSPAHHVRRYLRASEAVAALLDEASRRERLLALVRASVPSRIAEHCRQAVLDDRELTVFVDSPVWVDRLRFLSSQLIDALSSEGVNARRCSVRVLPPSSGPAAAGADAGTGAMPSASAAAALHRASLAVGGTALSEALARLARTMGYPEL